MKEGKPAFPVFLHYSESGTVHAGRDTQSLCNVPGQSGFARPQVAD